MITLTSVSTDLVIYVPAKYNAEFMERYALSGRDTTFVRGPGTRGTGETGSGHAAPPTVLGGESAFERASREA